MRDEPSLIQKVVRRVSEIIVVVALAWFVVHCFLTQAFVSGHSMEPTLQSNDLVLVDAISYDFFAPKRMDIVVFERADHTESIKRIVGLPNETLIIQNGRIYIDGTLLDAKEIGNISLAGIAERPIELQDNEYFLLGDNADASEDSRFSNVGNVKRAQIIGKVWFRLKPFRSFGLIGRAAK